MNNKKKIPILIIICLAMLLSLSACTNGDSSGEENTYNIQYPYSAQGYTSFLNKEIEPVTNEIVTQMMIAKSIVEGEYSASDAILSAKSSLKIVQDSFSAVDEMTPAVGYEQNRIAVLTALQETESVLNSYVGELQKEQINQGAIQSLSAKMKAQYTVLTSQFNICWK